MMKKTILIAILSCACIMSMYAGKKPNLTFDANDGVKRTLVMPNGQTVEYTAYERLYFVGNVEDSTCQYMNVYVPKGATQKTPIILRTYAREDKPVEPTLPTGLDATGRALQEGYVVAVPGARFASPNTQLLDLKAAVRYLRLFDKKMPGAAERIIADGTGVGGALCCLLGSTGNHPDYRQQLEEMGAADKRDDVFACISYSPFIDRGHADMAYEWLFNCTNNLTRPLTEEETIRSSKLATQYADYLNDLGLKDPADNSPLTANSFRSYLKRQLIKAAQRAKDAGAEIPDSIGFTFSKAADILLPTHSSPTTNDDRLRATADFLYAQQKPKPRITGEYLVNLDLETYLNYLATTQPIKKPAELSDGSHGDGSAIPFSSKNGSQNRPQTTAPHWYIRHGALDTETSFAATTVFAVRLQNLGKEVNFLLAWNRPYSGDYALDELFDWIEGLVHSS